MLYALLGHQHRIPVAYEVGELNDDGINDPKNEHFQEQLYLHTQTGRRMTPHPLTHHLQVNNQHFPTKNSSDLAKKAIGPLPPRPVTLKTLLRHCRNFISLVRATLAAAQIA